MALSQSQRQHRSNQKAIRRKEVVAQKRKAEMVLAGGEEERLIAEAAQRPLAGVLYSEALFEEGMGWVIVGRQMPSGSIATSVFLIDSWCLGIKDAFFRLLDKEGFLDRVEAYNSTQTTVSLEPGKALKLLHDAAAFADGLGLKPAQDFGKVVKIFGDFKMSADTFSFGRDGKPFYFAGPNDSPSRQRQIMNTLSKHLALDAYDYMITV